jgi:mannose-6-phosphate isomerase-like protein (cupin superfamily)
MKISNLFKMTNFFEVFETRELSQVAAMMLEPGESTSEEPSTHRRSEQIVLIVEGELSAEIGTDMARLNRGDIVIVPKSTPHKFTNTGRERALAFTAYAPPAY